MRECTNFDYQQTINYQQQTNDYNMQNDGVKSKPKTQYKGLSSDEYFGRTTTTTVQQQSSAQSDIEQALSTGLKYI